MAKKQIAPIVFLLTVVLCAKRGDKVLFIMNTNLIVHGMIVSSAGCYTDLVRQAFS